MWISRLLCCSSSTVPMLATQARASTLYHRILDPALSSSEVASLAAELHPLIGNSGLVFSEKFALLRALHARSVRHEGVVNACLWGILKVDLPPLVVSFDGPGQLTPARRHFALCTASSFRILTDLGFTTDHQMLALALGRCIEVTPALDVNGVAEVYQGLLSLNREHFSLTEVALSSSMGRGGLLTNSTTLNGDEDEHVHSSGRLANQPNLIDIACSALEKQMESLSCTPSRGHLNRMGVGWKDGTSTRENRPPVPCLEKSRVPDAVVPAGGGSDARYQVFETILRALATVGVHSADTLTHLQSVLPRRWKAPLDSLVASLEHAVRVRGRVVDPLSSDEPWDLGPRRAELIRCLCKHLLRQKGLAQQFRHSPTTVLQLRRLFESTPLLMEDGGALWDVVRCIKVAHRHAVCRAAPSPRLTGELGKKKYAVKVKPVTLNYAEAERFVPPQFKTWRSPQHTPRGGHKPATRSPRRMAFGTRRISKNYLKGRRKTFCPAVA